MLHAMPVFIAFMLFASGQLYAINQEVPYNLSYRQLHYQLYDLQGDYSLATRVQMSPKAIFYSTIGQSDKLNQYLEMIQKEKEKYAKQFNPFERLMDYESLSASSDTRESDLLVRQRIIDNPEIDDQQKETLIAQHLNDQLIIEGRDNPINRQGLINALKQVMVEEFQQNAITPTRGHFHQWSANFKSQYFKDSLLVLPVSKLLAALALGKTYLYMYTGKEKQLVESINQFPHNSLTFPELFRISYRINNGDVYLALLTVENTLSYHWMDENRENLLPIKKLRPINNFYQNRGDKFGSWYHLYGLILYGHVKGRAKGNIVGLIESIGSHIMSGFEEEMQEDWINAQGAPIGAALREFVDNRDYLSWHTATNWLEERHHLNLSEDFNDRLYFSHDSRFSITLDKELRENQAEKSTLRIVIRSNDLDLSDCDVRIYSEEKNRQNNRPLHHASHINLKRGKMQTFFYKTADPSYFYRKLKVKAMISNCQQDKQQFQLSQLRLIPN